MKADELAELRRRAEAGEPDAMTAFGKVLVSAGPQHMLAGAEYVSRAADARNAEAVALLAVLVADGIGCAQNWERGLDHLRRAADMGFAPAQEQVRLLAERDFAEWLTPPQASQVFEQPRMLTVRGLMTEPECKRFIDLARPKLRRAGVYDHATGGEVIDDERSNTRAELWRSDLDMLALLLQARMSALLGLSSRCFEMTNVLHYRPGQEFKQHVDFLHTNEPGMAADIQRYGQRVATVLVYLNEDYEGGETHFPRLDWAFKGNAGDALIFFNVNAQGEPEPFSLHAGLPPARGEKWLLSQWVRSRPMFPL